MSHETPSKLGPLLKQAREQRGLTIAQAASATRILARYLMALERGDYDQLPGDVYARGFIRLYAQLLDLPAEEMVELYRAERGGSRPIRIEPASLPPRTRSCLAPSLAVIFFSVGLLVVLTYLILNALGVTRSITQGTSTPEPTAIATPQPLPTNTATPTTAPGDTPVPQPGDTPAPPSVTPTLPAPVTIDLRLVDQPSWMQVLVDGVLLQEGIQESGYTTRITAQNQVQLSVGNAIAVEVSINGGPPQRLGGQGEVRTVLIGPNGIQP